MNVLIVHAHPETRSFSSALAATARDTLAAAGHKVELLDLYRAGFDPVSDRRNFTTTADADYFKQQAEESHATEHDGFVPELEQHIALLERCDLLVFSFPLWWFGMPAILKGWVDRVFAAGRIYGGPKLYEGGIGAGKKAMVLMTTGGGPDMYSGRGVNPPMDHILQPIEHGVFWFNGFGPLDPFIAWSPARQSDEERGATLDSLRNQLSDVADQTPRVLPPLADFPGFGVDSQGRFHVVVTRKFEGAPDEAFVARVPEEKQMLSDLRRSGVLLEVQFTGPDDPAWRGFLTFRAPDRQTVDGWLAGLPLASYFDFEVSQIVPAG
ncbi:MAG: NAD(P)H-dependent oxidoreductase [Planctomycetota bacterium]